MDGASRRGTLRLLGVSVVGAGAGCTSVPFLSSGSEDEHEPGALVVTNQHSLAHVVGVSVTAPESVENENASGETLQVIEMGLDGQIPVEADETKVYPDFLSGSVLYTVKMWLGTSESNVPPNADDSDDVVAAEFSPEASETHDARGSYLTARMEPSGRLTWTVSYVY